MNPALVTHERSDALIPVAEYVRMSTDHQRYSTENQSAEIAAYAARHGMTIVRTYKDEGKSGLDIGGRVALRQLISDVEHGRLPCRAILVYDISRWGRFQDPDEAAHYEYLCTQAGIRIIYCAEPFDNDRTPLATIVKSVKRSMAAEYSRELSTKVFAGQCRLVRLGFHQGGMAGYGLRRALFDEQRNFKGELTHGENKSIQTDRVLLIPGPQDEIATVQRIYAQFIQEGKTESVIADSLNNEGITTDLGRPWTRGTVHQVLTNEKYIGNNVYNRTSGKLRRPSSPNAPELWVRCDGAFEGIVSKGVFEAVRQIIAERSKRVDDTQMLLMLSALLERAGELSGLIIDEQDNMPSSSSYQSRFGGLLQAYTLIGYEPNHDYRYLAINRHLRAWRPDVVQQVTVALQKRGGRVVRDETTDLVKVNGQWTVSVVLARCQVEMNGRLRWKLRFDTALQPDITVGVRMDEANERARDYYLMPSIDVGAWPKNLDQENHAFIDGYRFETLDVLAELAAETALEKAA